MADEKLPKIDQDWVEKHVGLVCESCGETRWWVTNTYRHKDEIVRRRVCRYCGHVSYSSEKLELL